MCCADQSRLHSYSQSRCSVQKVLYASLGRKIKIKSLWIWWDCCLCCCGRCHLRLVQPISLYWHCCCCSAKKWHTALWNRVHFLQTKNLAALFLYFIYLTGKGTNSCAAFVSKKPWYQTCLLEQMAAFTCLQCLHTFGASLTQLNPSEPALVSGSKPTAADSLSPESCKGELQLFSS